MKAILAEEEQSRHFPSLMLTNGVMRPNPESPERLAMMKAGAEKAGLRFERPKDYRFGPIARVHTPEYLAFLERAHERWRSIDGAAEAVTPNIHPTRRGGGYPDSVIGQAGYHMLDIGAPIVEGTWRSAVWSAWCAVHAAESIIDGARSVYALCRPPGHHAQADAAAGFCYFNNAAIAAEHLKERFPRRAILDVDVHHGNGTQDIFYTRSDVLTVSIHAHPREFYPFVWGYESERGEGEGLGFNFNLPLPRGEGDDAWLDAARAALARIAAFGPDALILSLGVDASKDDPHAGLMVTTDGFARAGEAIGKTARMPIAIVQEGGYPSPTLTDNLAAFLSAFAGARRA